jgi:hypothetical protein
MIRLLLVTSLFAIGACATPGSEPTSPESGQAMQSGGDELLEQNAQAQNNDESIQDIDAPNARATPPEEMPHQNASESDVVCERVVPTGSVLPTKVCRRKSDIDRRQKADQRMYDDIKRNTALGADGL